MNNSLTRWMKRHKKDSEDGTLEDITLEDVTPLHPNEYPAQHLKEILDGRRDELEDIHDRVQSNGIPEGPGGF